MRPTWRLFVSYPRTENDRTKLFQPSGWLRLSSTIFSAPQSAEPEKIQLEWQEGSDTYFNAQTLSDGTLHVSGDIVAAKLPRRLY